MDDMDEPILPDAEVNGTAAVGTAAGPEASEDQRNRDATSGAGHVALTPSFLSGLAAAMRETAKRERDRISGVVAEDAAAHVEKVRSRAAIETDELQRLAEEDVGHIQEWSASEIERIQGEAAQKVEDRRSGLGEYLKQHDTIIETEIEAVESAVRKYEATLDRYFAELAELTDPSEIVRRAGQLPTPPDLDEIRASARASAMNQLAESETTEPAQAVPQPPRVEEVSQAAAVEVLADAASPSEPVDAMAAVAETESPESSESIESGDDGAMIGVMDDGAGSVEPAESAESNEPEVVVAEELTHVGSAAASEDGAAAAVAIGVMEPDAQRSPSWPAPAPREEAAQVAPTIDRTSAAVRLLRSVAPWTAPTHAGDPAQSDSD